VADAQRGLLIAVALVLAAVSGSSAQAGRALADCQLTAALQLDRGCGAVLLHPRVLVYPAHCRGPFEQAGGRAIERCQSYPDGSLFGTDIAFCVLRGPADELPIIAPALGCEVEHVTEGQDAWFAGQKQLRRGVVLEVSDEISVAGPGFGVCPGDSGGPLFVEVPDGDQSALRVAGILSASSQEECAEAMAYFTPLWPFIAWIEAESGFDLSPCGEPDGSWNPGAACQSRSSELLDADACDVESAAFASATCGAAAVQNGTPSDGAKGQNTASCQSVLVTRTVQTHATFCLMCLGLCAAVALRRRARASKI
jgi:hypothetical protein